MVYVVTYTEGSSPRRIETTVNAGSEDEAKKKAVKGASGETKIISCKKHHLESRDENTVASRAADAAAAWNKQNAHSAQDASVFKDDKDGQVAKRAWISHFETGLKHAHAKWEQANKRSDYRRTNEIEKDISKLEKALNDVKANKYPDKDQMALGKEWYNNY